MPLLVSKERSITRFLFAVVFGFSAIIGALMVGASLVVPQMYCIPKLPITAPTEIIESKITFSGCKYRVIMPWTDGTRF